MQLYSFLHAVAVSNCPDLIDQGYPAFVVKLFFVERDGHQASLGFTVVNETLVKFKRRQDIPDAVHFGLRGGALLYNGIKAELPQTVILDEVQGPRKTYNGFNTINLPQIVTEVVPGIECFKFENIRIDGTDDQYITIFTEPFLKTCILNTQ